MPSNIYRQNLERDRANYAPLTPISLLERSAQVYPDKTAVIHGDRRFTYAQFRERCHRLASALSRRGIGEGDTVAVMAPNVPAMLEAHFGVPMVGAVLNALNTRLDAASIAFCLEHGEAKLLITDREYADVIEPALRQIGRTITGDRHRRSPRRGCGTAAGRDGLRGLHRRGRSLFSRRDAGR